MDYPGPLLTLIGCSSFIHGHLTDEWQHLRKEFPIFATRRLYPLSGFLAALYLKEDRRCYTLVFVIRNPPFVIKLSAERNSKL